MRILLVDDDEDSREVLGQTLRAEGNQVEVASDGLGALDSMCVTKFDVVLTDWMLETMDGIDLIRRIRERAKPSPLIIMLTAISNAKARVHALQAGADDYIAKPAQPRDVAKRLKEAYERHTQPAPIIHVDNPAKLVTPPPYIAVVLVANAGGPVAVRNVLQTLPAPMRAASALFLLMRSPDWMIETLPGYLQGSTKFKVCKMENRLEPKQGNLYLAPAESRYSMVVKSLALRIVDEQKDDFLGRPADFFLRSMVSAFGRYCVVSILTGNGTDSVQGAGMMRETGGAVLVQDPKGATVAALPEAALRAGVSSQKVALDDMGKAIGLAVSQRADELWGRS